MRTLRIGISPCPNDTFAFAALMEGHVQVDGVRLEFELHDVQELNERVLAGGFDVAKVSFHAALLAAQDLWILPSGSALGFGVGPLLLAAHGRADVPEPRVLTPGATTTATLLWELFHGERAAPQQVVFSEIMPALARGEADLGVCIHEGRFTWESSGLDYVEDLGERWERETGQPLPLGGIAARRSLPRELVGAFQAALAESIRWAWGHREECLPILRRHAQELEEDVLWSHVELYVNDWTQELGEVGRTALAALSDRAARAGRLRSPAPLEVFE